MAKKTYQQIQAQIAALQKEADVAHKREVQNVVRDIKASIALYGLTAEDLGLSGASKPIKARGGRKKSAVSADGQPVAKTRKPVSAAKKSRGSAKQAVAKKAAGKKAAAKKVVAAVARFADGAGNSWSGRGPRPGWLKEAIAQGKSADDFRV